MNLETVQMEASVGPFSCDIVAKEVGSGVRVAMENLENQLELTNHSHLGQLLTYAAGWTHKSRYGSHPIFSMNKLRPCEVVPVLWTARGAS